MCRSPALAALALLTVLVLLATCGRPTPQGESVPLHSNPQGRWVPQHPKDTTPNPTAVAAGAPLRTRLLAQLDEYERESCATAPRSGSGECRVAHNRPGFRQRYLELASYASWVEATLRCGYDRHLGQYARHPSPYDPTLSEMREPWRLDAYVARLEWCGSLRPDP